MSKSINNKTPWFNKNLVKLARKRNSAHKKAIITFSPSKAWESFRHLKTLFTKEFRLAKTKHFNDFVSKTSSSTKKFWKYIDPYINPNKVIKVSATDILNDQINNSDQDAANTFSNYFKSILNKFEFRSTVLCTRYIIKHFESIPALSCLHNTSNKFEFNKINEKEVYKLLTVINANSAAGSSQIEIFNN